MGLGDLTLLLVGRDALAEQLHVHLEHRGADIERTEASEALDTIRVAIPDLIIISNDASASDGERIRDGLMKAGGKPPRLLALCDKKLAAKIATYKHDFVAALEHDAGADLIASCIESLCALLGKASSATRPLRSLVADVKRSHMPSKPISASKQTLAGTVPLVVPPAAAAPAPAPAPAPIAAAPEAVAPVPQAPKKTLIAAPKPIASLTPERASQPTPLSALLAPHAPAKIAAPIALSAPAPAAARKTLSMPSPIASKAIAQPSPIAAPAPEPAPVAVIAPAPAPAPAPVAAPAVVIEDQAPQAVAEVEDRELELDIAIGSLPPPSLPTPSLPTPSRTVPSLPAFAASSPSPTPLFVETHTATPAPPAPTLLRPSRLAPHLAKARALVMRLSLKQRYAAAAALFIGFAFVTAATASRDEEAPIATEATASLSVAANAAKPDPAPKPAPTALPAPRLAAAPPPAAKPEPAVAAKPEPEARAIAAQDSEAPEDSMVDGELYDPHADPARAKANYLVNMGHRLRKQGRFGMAEASYLKALTAFPSYARAMTGLVAVHLGRRDGVEAVRWAKKLVDMQPKRGAHHRLLGDAYALAGNANAARASWQQAVRLGDRTARARIR